MKAIGALCVLFLALAAYGGESFDERERRANELEKTPDGQAYQDEMWSQVGSSIAGVMQSCVKGDPALEGTVFTLLVTLSPDGQPGEIEVEPVTTVTKCVADGFAELSFPKPPAGLSVGGMPLVFVLHIHMHEPPAASMKPKASVRLL